MLAPHTRAALQFSGGKDSLAVLYLAREHLENITVFFADTGAVYPHVVEFVHRTCVRLGAELVVVKPAADIFAYTEQVGLPSDIVPVRASVEMAMWLHEKPPQLIQSTMACCRKMLWTPLYHAILDSGIKLVLRGTKACDPHKPIAEVFSDENGIEYRSPLWSWSDQEVFDYLADKEMPDQYPEISDSMDCWICTGHMHGDYAAAKLAYAKRKYPNLWPEIERRVTAVRSTVERENALLAAAMKV